jgi:mannose-6-phosphate isomerase-like protein (cupin superfamily)
MPKVSKDTADEVVDFTVAEDRTSDLDGYTVNFVSIRETHDLAPMLKVLPGEHCSCPHWGYMLKGRMTVTYGDQKEVLEPGDAFYMTPGHTPAAEAGTEFVMFSPADELAATDAAVKAGMQAVHGA